MKKYLMIGLIIGLFSSQYASAKTSSLLTLPHQLSNRIVDEIMLQKDMFNSEELNDNDSFGFKQIELKTYAEIGFNILFFDVQVKPTLELRWERD